MSWEDVENAMQTAVSLASGLPSDQVTWSYQDFNEPEEDHIVITFAGAIAIGVDRLETSYNAARPNGQEFRFDVKGLREVPFELEAFTATKGRDTAARHLLELTRNRFRLDNIKYTLRRYGVTVFDTGPVIWVPDIPSAEFRGRATCTLRCYVPVQDCFEYAGRIDRVTGTIYATGFVSTGTTGTWTFDSDNAP